MITASTMFWVMVGCLIFLSLGMIFLRGDMESNNRRGRAFLYITITLLLGYLLLAMLYKSQ